MSRTLVLFGPRDRLTLSEELISKFEDKGGEAGEVRIYYTQVSSPVELAQMIRQAVPGVAGPEERASSAAAKAQVIADSAEPLDRRRAAGRPARRDRTVDQQTRQTRSRNRRRLRHHTFANRADHEGLSLALGGHQQRCEDSH